MNRNYTALCAALLMCAFLIVLYVSPKISPGAVAFAAASDEKVVYLTFDDGPSDRVTPRILDVLKEENIKATFFIVGKNAQTRKDILKREADEGHTLGVHSYSHKYGEIYSSAEKLLEDIDKCNKIIKEVTGKTSSVYRFPGGSYGLSDSLISAVTGHGLRYVDWNASTRDAELTYATPYLLLKAAKDTSANRNNVVLLSHDSTDKMTTADALKSIIDYYKNLNYKFKAF